MVYIRLQIYSDNLNKDVWDLGNLYPGQERKSANFQAFQTGHSRQHLRHLQ